MWLSLLMASVTNSILYNLKFLQRQKRPKRGKLKDSHFSARILEIILNAMIECHRCAETARILVHSNLDRKYPVYSKEKVPFEVCL